MEEVLACWFSASDRWWRRDAAFDEEIRARVGPLREEILRGEHADWRGTARGALAYVVVLDQLSRNMFRGTPRAFEGDARALGAAREALARGDDATLASDERLFLYMPFMHSEALADQDRSLALFRALGGADALHAAEKHHAIIARFGRFPHRNAILGRASTPEEIAFLEEPGSSFG